MHGDPREASGQTKNFLKENFEGPVAVDRTEIPDAQVHLRRHRELVRKPVFEANRRGRGWSTQSVCELSLKAFTNLRVDIQIAGRLAEELPLPSNCAVAAKRRPLCDRVGRPKVL